MSVFIGYDSREGEAYEVCKKSLSPYGVTIRALNQNDLRSRGIYSRPADPLASTEFTYTRFLVPYLTGYKGWSMFVDCDFVFLSDPTELLKNISTDKAVYVAQHADYVPRTISKMDGKPQSAYPRKNWSSLILWNCSHPKCQQLTPEVINSQTPAYLHRFEWLNDEEIGSIPIEWNWLVGYYKETDKFKPKALHFTDGGPWFENYQNCEYSEVYNRFKQLL